MQISNCAVVIKQTAFVAGGRAAQMARQGDATARRIRQAHDAHQRTTDDIRALLTKQSIPFSDPASGSPLPQAQPQAFIQRAGA